MHHSALVRPASWEPVLALYDGPEGELGVDVGLRKDGLDDGAVAEGVAEGG